MSARFFVAWLFACLLAAGGGRAGELPAVGEVHRSTVFVLGKPVPLPPGDWTVIGQGYGPVAGPSPGAYGAIGGVVLAQQRDGLVDGLVIAHANLLPVEGGWGPAAECRRLDAVYATGVAARGPNVACGYVLVLPARDVSIARLPAWGAGRAEALRRGWRIPGALALAGLRVGDRRDVVDVRYAWAATAAPTAVPRLERASLVEAAAEPARIRASALASWMLRALAELRSRIEDPLAPIADLPPLGAAARIAGPPPGASRWHRRVGSLLANRVVHAALAAGAGLVVTGSAYTAGLVAALQTAVGGTLGKMVEFGWEWEAPRPPMQFGLDPRTPTG